MASLVTVCFLIPPAGSAPSNGNGQLTANHNHCNANGTADQSNRNNVAMEHSSFKIQTLKRKLKAELEQSMYKTISFKEAFQKEMDLRTKLDDKFENLRVRYEVRELL
jgi:hypothetical protein